LCGKFLQVLVDNIADVLQIGGECEYLCVLGAGSLVVHDELYPGQVEFDGMVEAVDVIVEDAYFRDALLVARAESIRHANEHSFNDIGHSHRFSSSVREGEARNGQDSVVEIKRCPRQVLIRHWSSCSYISFEDPGGYRDEKQERERQYDVENRMKIRSQTRR